MTTVYTNELQFKLRFLGADQDGNKVETYVGPAHYERWSLQIVRPHDSKQPFGDTLVLDIEPSFSTNGVIPLGMAECDETTYIFSSFDEHLAVHDFAVRLTITNDDRGCQPWFVIALQS